MLEIFKRNPKYYTKRKQKDDELLEKCQMRLHIRVAEEGDSGKMNGKLWLCPSVKRNKTINKEEHVFRTRDSRHG